MPPIALPIASARASFVACSSQSSVMPAVMVTALAAPCTAKSERGDEQQQRVGAAQVEERRGVSRESVEEREGAS